MILIYGRRRDVLLREQKHHHGHQFFLVLASWVLGSAKFACLQRQKPAMFAQMPLFVYRHFTGAVRTTSSDSRFALFSAPSTPAFSPASRLSNLSDILLSDIFRAAPICRQSPVARTRFKTLIYLKRFGAGACGHHESDRFRAWGGSMFLAFQYGVMYVLSFATIITVFATAIALAVWVVMIACRSIWRLLRRRSIP